MKSCLSTYFTFSIFVQIAIYLSMGICKKLHLNKIEKQDGYTNQNHTNTSIASSALNISEELFLKLIKAYLHDAVNRMHASFYSMVS